MARPLEEKPWHADVLRLRSEGISYSQIAKAIGIKENTIKAFLHRNKDNEGRQAQILLQDKPQVKLAPVTLSDSDSTELSDLLVLVERKKARVTMKLLQQVEKVIDMPSGGLDEWEVKKGAFAVEALGKLKSNAVTVNATQNNTLNQVTVSSERMEAVRGRLKQLAASNA